MFKSNTSSAYMVAANYNFIIGGFMLCFPGIYDQEVVLRSPDTKLAVGPENYHSYS